MGFANDIIGGAAALIRAAIKSPNFVHGSAGWSVNKDGSAEFQNATVRGTISASSISGATISGSTITGTTFDGTNFIINGSGSFFYSGPPALGNLIFSISNTSGTDAHGNAFFIGAVSYNGSSQIADLINGRLELLNEPSGTGFGLGADLAGDLTIFPVSGSGSILLTAATQVQAALTVFSALTATGGTPGSPTQISTDSWNTVTTPTGMTGTIRVKLLPLQNMAVLDINVTITSTSTSPVSFTAGALPSASYYPTGQRQYDLSVQQQFTATSNASPRVSIPASGALQLPMPGFASAGLSCLVSGTIIYPLD